MTRKRRDYEEEDDERPKRKVFGSDGGAPAVSLGSQDKTKKAAVLKAHIISLNKQFKAHIASSDEDELWTDAAREYIAHVDGLLAEFNEEAQTALVPSLPPPVEPAASAVTFGKPAFPNEPAKPAFVACSIFGGSKEADKTSTAPTTTTTTGPSGFTFGTDLSAKPALLPKAALFTFSPAPITEAPAQEAAAAKTTSLTFSFGASVPPSTGASTPTAESAPALPSFAFGQAPASAPTSTTTTTAAPLFSFGGAAAPSIFTFNSAAPPAAFGAPAAAEEEGGEEEQPQKFESEVAVSEEAGSILFKAKSKFSHLLNKAWEGKGVGTLMIRKRGSDKPFITFTTEAGRVLYIANIPKTMNVLLNNERNNVTFSAPWSPDGASPPSLQGVMFQLPKGKNVEFKAEVEKQQGLMA